MFCEDIKPLCKDKSHGSRLRKACPETCGLCDGDENSNDDDDDDDDDDEPPPLSSPHRRRTKKTEDECKDTTKSIGFDPKTEDDMFCKDIKWLCKSKDHGSRLRKQCPETCGLCGGGKSSSSRRRSPSSDDDDDEPPPPSPRRRRSKRTKEECKDTTRSVGKDSRTEDDLYCKDFKNKYMNKFCKKKGSMLPRLCPETCGKCDGDDENDNDDDDDDDEPPPRSPRRRRSSSKDVCKDTTRSVGKDARTEDDLYCKDFKNKFMNKHCEKKDSMLRKMCPETCGVCDGDENDNDDDDDDDEPSTPRRRRSKKTKEECEDTDESIGFDPKTEEEMFCKDIKYFCKDKDHGPRLKKSCPKTCKAKGCEGSFRSVGPTGTGGINAGEKKPLAFKAPTFSSPASPTFSAGAPLPSPAANVTGDDDDDIGSATEAEASPSPAAGDDPIVR